MTKYPMTKASRNPDKLLSAKITELFWNFVLWNFFVIGYFVIHGLPYCSIAETGKWQKVHSICN